MKRFQFDHNRSVSQNQRRAERAGAKVGDIIIVTPDTYYRRIDARETKEAHRGMLKKGTKWIKV